MSTTPNKAFDAAYVKMIDEVQARPLDDDATGTAIKNLKLFSESRARPAEPEPTPKPVPTTLRGKLQAGLARVWDNETTRVLIKSGGAFAGVALVTYTTIHRDHVLERQAIAQANQRPS